MNKDNELNIDELLNRLFYSNGQVGYRLLSTAIRNPELFPYLDKEDNTKEL